MSVRIGKRLRYKDLFDDEPLDFHEYFKGVGKEDIYKAISFLVNVANPNHKHHNPKDMVSIWFCDENKELREALLSKLNNGDSIANIISSLKLMEFVMQSSFDENRTKSDAEFEIDLFKAYLLLNSEQDIIEEKGHKNLPPEKEKDERMLGLFLAMNFHDSDLTNYNLSELMIIQLIKSIDFFKYLESRKELNPHLKLFLSKYNSDSWEDWIKKYLAIIFPIIQKEEKSFFDYTIAKDENYEMNCKFFDSFTINDENDFRLSDFITLRSNPILKIDEGHYRILNKLFLVEKLFKSIQFQFSLQINKEVSKDEQIKDFRSDHCDNFSERTLLYNILRNSFPKKNWIHLSGDDFLAKGYSAEPDFYVRFKNKVFLFESKDVVLKGEEKQSRDYPTLKKALSEKFYKIEKGGKIEQKAVLQIIENIKRILTVYYDKCDKGYNPKNIKIYPILIIHDRQFDSLSVNELISNWFELELSKIKGEFDTSNVQQIIVLNIDTMILYQETFKQRGNNRLEKLISDYHENIKFEPAKYRSLGEVKAKKLNSLRPFTNFVDVEFDKRKVNKIPTHVMKYAKELFKDEKEGSP
ncbi:hypothetical protein QWY85_05700 [Neolewinella lacunae]|uniref:Uncharacterized protein n=1 Tax=Neolewinella lacunae TaxID=1517758 RepID=A0A923T7S7_9BACT|nr:hypothetical protein [Neolewinella lacunae]MBC6993208.1 hypothetical protein [Neolewinella lacunae]MDN3634145.1 hypothetical protein [Neolewinella lacunae]